jgi:hypothetical protein
MHLDVGNSMSYTDIIFYSFGTDKFDNQPKQKSAECFQDFQQQILANRSPKKGLNYFCSAFELGEHNEPEKYPGARRFRLKKLAKPRRFAALDFDGFYSVATYQATLVVLKRFRGFGYETWSHSPSNPRARAVLELSRDVSALECVALCRRIEREIEESVGAGKVNFDKSVYQLEQPIYGPPIGARVFDFNGPVINVDDLIEVVAIDATNNFDWLKNKPTYLRQTELASTLRGKMVPPDETPRQIMILMNMLKCISADCSYEVYRRVVWAILSTGWDCAIEIAFDWSMTVPNRFSQATLNDLIRGFNVGLSNCPSYGTIRYLARQGGWDGQ